MRRTVLVLLFALCSCAMTDAYRIADQNLSLADVKQSILAVIGEPRSLSQNQRVFFSQYFSRKPDTKFDPEKSRERLYAKVSVLGDRRPYDVEVEVIVEVREGDSYYVQEYELSEAKKIGREIRSKLNQSRENRNVIDDFRAF